VLALQILAITFTLALIGFVVFAIRRSLLNARYALVWLAAGVVLLVLSVFRPMLDWVALTLGVAYPPSLLFLVAFIFLLIIVLHYSLVISSHRDSIRRLGQAVAQLEQEIRDLRRQEDQNTASSPRNGEGKS
jgi:hypothetical protein